MDATLHSLILKLHPLERAVLPHLTTHSELPAISKAAKLDETETMRALQWLENKQAVTIHGEKKKLISLGKNGILYQKIGLPEKILLATLSQEYKSLNVLTKKSRLSREEVTAAIGLLRKKNAVELKKEQSDLLLKITDTGKHLAREIWPEEEFLQQQFPVEMNAIKDTAIIEQLRRRKDFLHLEEKQLITASLTELGQQLAAQDLSAEVTNRLTPKMLQDGSWKEQQFRAYDVEVNVPAVHGGKKHIVTQATEYAKKVWMDMGFKEMTDTMVQTSFWNFDTLFTAQDHPVREMQDTFFLGGAAEKGRLPKKELVEEVKNAHENGGTTGSTGWGGKWNEEEAKKNVLRTHTTALTAHTLASLKKEHLPAKFFALGKNFRNEALDQTHLNEFNQTEGIVVDKKVNFRHLLGYLKQFFAKMGYPQARFRPAFFPYTSPSVEIDVFHPLHQKWVEFGGAGMLRPEVVVPLLGEDIPVLAWGPGFDRIILEYWNIKDIRDLYRNDLKQLREWKVFLR